MNTIKTQLFDLDYLQTRMSRGLNILNAIHEATLHGTLAASDYSDAIFGAYEYLTDLNAELRSVIDEVYEQDKQSEKIALDANVKVQSQT